MLHLKFTDSKKRHFHFVEAGNNGNPVSTSKNYTRRSNAVQQMRRMVQRFTGPMVCEGFPKSAQYYMDHTTGSKKPAKILF